MPTSPAVRTASRTASTPLRCPIVRGSPRELAQRPLPSMMMATCVGTFLINGFDISSPKNRDSKKGSLDLHDFLFLVGEQAVDVGNHLVGHFLDPFRLTAAH